MLANAGAPYPWNRIPGTITWAVGVAMTAGVASAQSFTGLGFLPGGGGSYSYGVSGDASVAVGFGYVSSSAYRDFRWTTGGGMASLGTLSGWTASRGYAVSGDGSVVVGWGGSSIDDPRAFRWTSGGGMVSLGTLPGSTDSMGRAVSGDGAVVVGWSGLWMSSYPFSGQAFHWTSGEGMVGLGVLPGDSISMGFGVNQDGSVVVGVSGTDFHISAPYRTFRWTKGGLASLGTLPGGTHSSANAAATTDQWSWDGATSSAAVSTPSAGPTMGAW